MNIVVPMAGGGTRMVTKYGAVPKPLIEVAGRPMVAWALDSLKEMWTDARVIFIILKAHDAEFNLGNKLRALAGKKVEIVALDGITEGQLCTVMAAADSFDPDSDLLIASCDTFVASNLSEAIRLRRDDCRGIISVADMPGDRWSFARTDDSGRVVEVTEKIRISNHASTGLYYFSSAREFISIAEAIIRNQEKTRGEYYVISAYDKYIRHGWRIDVSVANEMWDLGTPEALEMFVSGHVPLMG